MHVNRVKLRMIKYTVGYTCYLRTLICQQSLKVQSQKSSLEIITVANYLICLQLVVSGSKLGSKVNAGHKQPITVPKNKHKQYEWSFYLTVIKKRKNSFMYEISKS